MIRSSIVAIAVVAFGVTVVLWIQPRFEIAGATTRDPRDLVALVNSQATVQADRWDSFESPRGTDYQVPAGATTYIVQLEGVPATSTQDVSIQIGYGDTAVANATSAPDAAVIVYAITVDDGLLPAPREVLIPIPAGKYPFMLMDAAGNLQATGFEK